MVLAAVFVPVVLHFGIVIYVVPSAFIAVSVGHGLLNAEFLPSLWALAHLAIYLLLFYAVARIMFFLSMRPRSPVGRWTIQFIAFIALFSCSFIRAVTYASLRGRGGTYTFWGAANRYFEKHQSR